MISKKDFTSIAAIIAKYNTAIDKASLITDLSNYFQAANPNFNKQRFLNACYPNIVKYFEVPVN